MTSAKILALREVAEKDVTRVVVFFRVPESHRQRYIEFKAADLRALFDRLGRLEEVAEAGEECRRVWRETHARVAPHTNIEDVTGAESLAFFAALARLEEK